ncbi:CBS domain-containing protein [Sphingomonas sp.]|uniref:CBS domain-containing protein n=1 Tax=Sphingomonas sp. TaxID=28214 RepID=UPI002CFEC6AC|nr:CBS domain-containing protein [Sphingomonas sp.]HTG38552.1 CBS domain-containing protein [Sphingomonas sp.]
MTIAKILETKGSEIVSAPISATAVAAMSLLAERGIGALPVMDGARVAGIFSERDVLHAIARDGAAALDRPVSELMTAPAVTVGPGQNVIGALALMTRRRIRHLPVVDGDRLLGFVSIGDLVKYRIDRIEQEAESMRAYIRQV